MTKPITATGVARRIARAHNETLSQSSSGGFLAFDVAGNGGEWYSSTARPDVAVLFPVGSRRVSAQDVQDWLDARQEQA